MRDLCTTVDTPELFLQSRGVIRKGKRRPPRRIRGIHKGISFASRTLGSPSMDRHPGRPDKTRPSHDDPTHANPRNNGNNGRARASAAETMSVRLTRKYAEAIDGVDLSGADVGDHLALPPRDAEVLIAEGWAEPTPVPHNRRASDVRAEAAEKQRRRRS